MIEYLKSEEFKTREDAQTSQDSVPRFIKMIESGLITTGSQEGLITTGYNPDTKNYYRIEERAFVDGFMKKEKAFAFVTKVNETSDKLAFVIRMDPSKEYLKLFQSDAKIPTIPLTISGVSKKSVADIREMHYDTSIPLALPAKFMDKDMKDITEAVEHVVVIDPVYGRKASSKKGLHHDILDVLKQIN